MMANREAFARDLSALLTERGKAFIWRAEIDRLRESHSVTQDEAREVLVGLWANELSRCLEDSALTDQELDYLFALRAAFDLGEDEIIAVEQTLIHPRFEREIAVVLADDTITPEERRGLAELGGALRISRTMQGEMIRREQGH